VVRQTKVGCARGAIPSPRVLANRFRDKSLPIGNDIKTGGATITHRMLTRFASRPGRADRPDVPVNWGRTDFLNMLGRTAWSQSPRRTQ